jgi:hypothetical protein
LTFYYYLINGQKIWKKSHTHTHISDLGEVLAVTCATDNSVAEWLVSKWSPKRLHCWVSGQSSSSCE